MTKHSQISLHSGKRSPRYRDLEPILGSGQDNELEEETGMSPEDDAHAGYVRGADYYGRILR